MPCQAPAGSGRPELKTLFVAPVTHFEKKLAKIWADVFDLDQVGIHDNFFELGGHSLAATRVMSQVSQMFRLELPIKALFDSPTIAEMAKFIAKQQEKPTGSADLERSLGEIESMSEDKARELLDEQDAPNQKSGGYE